MLEPRELTIVGNVGDDVEVLGLHVSPDLDSILYALAGLNDEELGWGRAGETLNALESVADLSDVVCPPYDVIAPDEAMRLRAANPFNAVRL